MNDRELLAAFVADGSNDAFEALAARHVKLVHATARRRLVSPHLADDATQAVFLILARKAGSIPSMAKLAGWLHRTTCHVTSTMNRAEIRRLNRERLSAEAAVEHREGDGSEWDLLAPELDSGLNRLADRYRDALILRFFQEMSLREVGDALGIGEEAARKRVSRGVEKLRGILARRGVVLSTTVMASLLAVPAAEAAPVGLTGAAICGNVTGTAQRAAGETLHWLSLIKLTKWAAVATVALIVSAAAATTRMDKASPAVLRHSGVDRTQVKGAIRYLAIAVKTGDARQFNDGLIIVGSGDGYAAALTRGGRAMNGFRRACERRFGGEAWAAYRRQLIEAWSEPYARPRVLESISGERARIAVADGEIVPLIQHQGLWKLHLAPAGTSPGVRAGNFSENFTKLVKVLEETTAAVDAGDFGSPEDAVTTMIESYPLLGL